MSGAELQAARKRLDMTQAELATALDVTQTTIARWESEYVERGTAQRSPRAVDLAIAYLIHTANTEGLRMPQGSFEQHLWATAIREQLGRWRTLPAPLQATVGPYQEDGTWLLTLQTVEVSWESFFGPTIVGRCWLAANSRSEPVVWWSIPTTEYGPAEENWASAPPVVAFP